MEEVLELLEEALDAFAVLALVDWGGGGNNLIDGAFKIVFLKHASVLAGSLLGG